MARAHPLTNHATRGRRRGLAPAVALAVAGTLSLGGLALTSTAGAFPGHHHSFLGSLSGGGQIASTVPPNGDLNPYGIVTVPWSTGDLVRGSTLVSNFNASNNSQGTGTTIVQISRSGTQSVFAELDGSLPGACPGGVGLTTALSLLPGGWVVVGSLPVSDMGTGTPEAGCLILLNSDGKAVRTWTSPDINGPWDMTSATWGNHTQLFVTNVLNGTVAGAGNVVNEGTVVRIDLVTYRHHLPQVVGERVIASGFAEQLNSSALVLGPTGVALGYNGTLYVADTVNSRIAGVPFASFRHHALGGGGFTVSAGGALNAPLGLMLAPNGNVIAANGGDGNAVEVSPQGHQVAVVQLDPLNAGGDLFGLTLTPSGRGILFVDDGDNTLKVLGH